MKIKMRNSISIHICSPFTIHLDVYVSCLMSHVCIIYITYIYAEVIKFQFRWRAVCHHYTILHIRTHTHLSPGLKFPIFALIPISSKTVPPHNHQCRLIRAMSLYQISPHYVGYAHGV